MRGQKCTASARVVRQADLERCDNGVADSLGHAGSEVGRDGAAGREMRHQNKSQL